ncbi:MAG: hypothetical protein R3B35_02175 [Gemmatimonadales bacterium]
MIAAEVVAGGRSGAMTPGPMRDLDVLPGKGDASRASPPATRPAGDKSTMATSGAHRLRRSLTFVVISLAEILRDSAVPTAAPGIRRLISTIAG